MTHKEIVKKWFSHIDTNSFNELRNLMDGNHRFQNPMTPAPIGVDEHMELNPMAIMAQIGANSGKG